eukprot:6974349-Prymnesium_polylepis.1
MNVSPMILRFASGLTVSQSFAVRTPWISVVACAAGASRGSIWWGGPMAVAYTHVTLPTICSV